MIKKGLTEELGRTITANECGLSTNDFSESIKILEGALKYIDQLEQAKQNLIDKLEKRRKLNNDRYGQSIDNDEFPEMYEYSRQVQEDDYILSLLR